MNTKFTPGPHEVSGTTIYALEHDSWRNGKEVMRNRFYSSIYGYKDTPREEIEATAILYASSPDLLKALQNLRNAAYSMSEGCNCNIADKEIELADIAIAKALGEQK